MAKHITCHIYDVSREDEKTPHLKETIENFQQLDLSKRWRNGIRLDKVKSINENFNGTEVSYFLMDFAKQREVGPGKVSDEHEASGIELPKGTTFGEETAALYCNKRWLIVLHNHYGIGATRMINYFNLLNEGMDPYKYFVSAKLDGEVEKKLAAMKGLKTLKVSASRAVLAQSDEVHLASVGEAIRDSGTEWINFDLRANQPHSRTNVFAENIRTIIENLKGRDTKEVSRLQVTGVDPVDEKDAVLDLIHHRLKFVVDIRELTIIDQKYTTESRWKILERALHYWIHKLC